MNYQQKDAILSLLNLHEPSRNSSNNYCFTYKDFLDPSDDFTDFSCERLGGKQGYSALIETLLAKDKSAKIFVQVYGMEEDHNERFIYADTLIIFSKLSLREINRIFNKSNLLFPSTIQEEAALSNPTFLIAENGSLIPIAKLSEDNTSLYICWWD